MKKTFRFALIPKVAHPWFEEVHKGALEQAALLKRESDADIAIDYLAPSVADRTQQLSILNDAVAAECDGIAIDPVDAIQNLPQIYEIKNQGIPVVLFDSPSPEEGITSVGNDFAHQGAIAARRLVGLIGGRGKVAVMQGFPTAPNHKERYEAQLAVLEMHPGISIVEGGIDNDDIETAKQQAAAVLASSPDLSGYLCCDASGPIGIAHAIREAKKFGKVRVVGMDGIRPILEAVKEGILESSSSTIPRVQGSMSILMLWQATLGVTLPQRIDTGIDIITQENVDRFLALS